MTEELVILSTLLLYLFIILLVVVLHSIFGPSKSKLYRRTLTDMYVIGKIKKFAKDEGIDIKKELSEYSKVMKSSRIDYESLDDSIEKDIQAKVTKCLIPIDSKPIENAREEPKES